VQMFKSFFVWVLIIGATIVAFNIFEQRHEFATKVPLNSFVQLVDEGKIDHVQVKGRTIVAVTKDGQRIETVIPPGSTVVDSLVKKGVRVEVESGS